MKLLTLFPTPGIRRRAAVAAREERYPDKETGRGGDFETGLTTQRAKGKGQRAESQNPAAECGGSIRPREPPHAECGGSILPQEPPTAECGGNIGLQEPPGTECGGNIRPQEPPGVECGGSIWLQEPPGTECGDNIGLQEPPGTECRGFLALSGAFGLQRHAGRADECESRFFDEVSCPAE
jgi:hypothetical protein